MKKDVSETVCASTCRQGKHLIWWAPQIELFSFPRYSYSQQLCQLLLVGPPDRAIFIPQIQLFLVAMSVTTGGPPRQSYFHSLDTAILSSYVIYYWWALRWSYSHSLDTAILSSYVSYYWWTPQIELISFPRYSYSQQLCQFLLVVPLDRAILISQIQLFFVDMSVTTGGPPRWIYFHSLDTAILSIYVNSYWWAPQIELFPFPRYSYSQQLCQLLLKVALSRDPPYLALPLLNPLAYYFL